ncbi:MAG TPA: hypothetical protein VMQ17_14240 [Candidatus Sulfotelmatobacter sp.]|nr:hypothetical protein [Candidatus Sulfotelmatobacter sp.]
MKQRRTQIPEGNRGEANTSPDRKYPHQESLNQAIQTVTASPALADHNPDIALF